MRPSASPDRAAVRCDSRRAISLPRRAGTTSPLHRMSPFAFPPLHLTLWERGGCLHCRWVAPGVQASFLRSGRVLGLPPPRSGLNRAGARRQPPFWFLVVAEETRCFLPSCYSTLTSVFTAYVGRISAHWSVSCCLLLGLRDAIILAGPRSRLRTVALGMQLHGLQTTPPITPKRYAPVPDNRRGVKA
ncbi:hypothetical protein NDU88_003689 [Pleurodeles waltl]|uniref:Uncharacterized protein n=1 Tax=Pleurodeles waltl TaxID=8319 RepID=A0AAV7V272_PLEWA|nr:hypothetical protein NDU88_003689 [Pleurodeles waltl]